MRRLVLVALLGLCSSCTFTGPGGEELTGIPVATAAEVFRGLADDIELWDVNKNGIIDGPEGAPLGLAATLRLFTAMSKQPDAVPDS